MLFRLSYIFILFHSYHSHRLPHYRRPLVTYRDILEFWIDLRFMIYDSFLLLQLRFPPIDRYLKKKKISGKEVKSKQLTKPEALDVKEKDREVESLKISF